MTALERLEERYKIGQAIFNKLFALSDVELIEKLGLITDLAKFDILNNNCDCVRTIRNSEPEKIEIWFYGGLRIDWNGVTFISEYGKETIVITFDQTFNIF